MEGSSLSQQWVDVLGMVGSVCNTCTAIAAARLTDKLKGHMKVSVMILLSLAAIFFTGLTLVSVQAIQLPSFVSLQIAIASLFILGSISAQTTSPLLLEFTVEVTDQESSLDTNSLCRFVIQSVKSCQEDGSSSGQYFLLRSTNSRNSKKHF